MSVWEWFSHAVDNALMALHCAGVLLVCTSAVACPVYLHLIYAELSQGRQQHASCKCGDERCPVLPRVLPRVRGIGEEADD